MLGKLVGFSDVYLIDLHLVMDETSKRYKIVINA